MSAVAAEITGAEREEPIAVFSRRNLLHGGAPWRLEDVEAPQRLRLYGATVREQYVSAAGDTRAKVLL
jgi:hypothetical protein